MATLRQFLTERRAEIQQQMKMLRAELRELDAASAALGDTDVANEGKTENRRERRGGLTLKAMAVEVLKQNPDGLEANDVRAKIAEGYGVDVQRSSMSPQLSRLAKDGVVRLAGHKWLLRTGQVSVDDWLIRQTEDEQEKGRTMETSPGPGMP